MKTATFIYKSRGFGGDNFIYKSNGDKIVVAVGWALLAPHVTTVTINGNRVAEYRDNEYIAPQVALARLDYIVQ